MTAPLSNDGSSRDFSLSIAQTNIFRMLDKADRQGNEVPEDFIEEIHCRVLQLEGEALSDPSLAPGVARAVDMLDRIIAARQSQNSATCATSDAVGDSELGSGLRSRGEVSGRKTLERSGQSSTASANIWAPSIPSSPSTPGPSRRDSAPLHELRKELLSTATKDESSNTQSVSESAQEVDEVAFELTDMARELRRRFEDIKTSVSKDNAALEDMHQGSLKSQASLEQVNTTTRDLVSEQRKAMWRTFISVTVIIVVFICMFMFMKMFKKSK